MTSVIRDYIAGAFITPKIADAERTLVSPADSSDTLGTLSMALDHVDAAVDSAEKSSRHWRRAGSPARAELLKRYQERLRENKDAIAHDIAREVGKPLWEAKTEVDAMIGKVDLSLGEGAEWTRDRVLETLPGEIRFRPHGVMAVVGPFNFPGHLPNGHIVPALLLGNTVVFKPSDKTPLTACWIARCMDEAGIPPGVFNVVQGDGAIAERLVTHEGVDGVLFTGSAAVGKRILSLNLDHPGRLVALELGGKNASIVLADAEIERAARQIAFSAFATAGQRCTATSRVFAAKEISSALCDQLTKIARALRVGHPMENVFMGPVISERSLAGLLDAQKVARDAGFEPLVPGGPTEVRYRGSACRGHYVRPSIHRAPARWDTDAASAYTETEIFGPDLCVIAVDSLEEAIDRTNATPYGLVASVYTASREAFDEAADSIRVGCIHWNRPTAGASSRLPFGGLKSSGNHRPAGITAGTSCAYPLAVFLPAKNEPLPNWPGFIE